MAHLLDDPEMAAWFARGVIERCDREIANAPTDHDRREWRDLRHRARMLRRRAEAEARRRKTRVPSERG